MSEFIEMSVIRSENVNGMMLDAYYMNGEPWFTREQISSALGYKSTDTIAKIHRRHQERLDRFSRVDKMSTHRRGEQNTYFYSERGVLEICRYSNSPVADAVMDTVFGVYLWVKEEIKKRELEAARHQVLEQVKEERDDRERRMEELAARMKEMGPVNYYYALVGIWGADTKRIDLEIRKRDAMEAAENELLGRPRQAYLYGMQNRVINDLEKYWPGEPVIR